jgi:RNA polymerase sigma factor (sigma-70 family)
MMSTQLPEDLWRAHAPQVLAALVRRHGDFDAAEDALQEALLAAYEQWPTQGVPDRPDAWLITVASRRLLDRVRAERARTERERLDQLRTPDRLSPAADQGDRATVDDSVALLLLCCHPELSRPSQIALTLRAVGGLTTAQIARAFLVPEATMAQRISRAKSRLRQLDTPFATLTTGELPGRVASVTQVLYVVFTEGHLSTAGRDLYDVSLSEEAIRLTRWLHARLPGLPPRRGRIDHPPRPTGPDPMGPRPPPGGHRADRSGPAGRASRSLPAAGGDRRGARGGRAGRGHRLDSDRGALPDAGR